MQTGQISVHRIHLRRDNDGAVAQFETAVEAVISGDAAALGSMLGERPELVRARSPAGTWPRCSTMWPPMASRAAWRANPPNAVEVAKILLKAGAEVDALADMYEARCTTMSRLLLRAATWAEAGLQRAPWRKSCSTTAPLSKAVASKWQSALLTALAFASGHGATPARRGAPTDYPPAAAGLGRALDAARLLPHADPESRQQPPSSPPSTATPRRSACSSASHMIQTAITPTDFIPIRPRCIRRSAPGHAEVVKLLVERGARLDIRDTIYQGTPLGWAIHCKKTAIADYL